MKSLKDLIVCYRQITKDRLKLELNWSEREE